MQASQRDPATGRTVYRWRLETSAGPKVKWAETEEAARTAVEAHGLEVVSIRPADSLVVEGLR